MPGSQADDDREHAEVLRHVVGGDGVEPAGKQGEHKGTVNASGRNDDCTGIGMAAAINSHVLPRNADVVLSHAAHSNNVLPNRKRGIVAGHNDADRGSAHDVAQRDWRHVLRLVAHPNALRGVDGHEQGLDQHLSGFRRHWNVLNAEFEVLVRYFADGSAAQAPAAML